MALTKVTNDLQDALAAAQPTITSVGTLTNFTSTGIDDNATSTAITIDASENVGVGVTPAAFNAASTAVQLPGGHFYDRTISETYIGNNSYHDSVDVTRAVNTGLASNIGFYSGNTVFQSAASVAAGALSTMVTNMTIDSSGKVKIASATTATPQLTIGGTAGGGSRGIELLDDNGGKYNFLIAAQQNVNNALEITPSTAAGGTTYTNPALVIDFSGQVSIGGSAISNAALTLENSANTKLIMRMSTASAGKYWRQEVDASNDLYIVNNGTAGVYIGDGSTSWSGISDENLKENIVELAGALDKVKDFRCVEYNLISDETNSKKIGFIAQDWQEDYSEIVSQDNDGNLGMKYTETIPVLLKAIQEQQTLIESLTARIEALEA